jgi:hypothetical protein
MTTVTLPNIPLEPDNPAQRLRCMAAATRVSMHWWGNYRALTTQQKEEVSAGYATDPRFLRAGKKLVDTRHEAIRRLTSIKTRIGKYWRGMTLPYVEDGIRLLRQSDIQTFVHGMEELRDELTQGEVFLEAAYSEIKDDARRSLGRLFNPADYPAQVRGLFVVEWEFPPIEPPSYLRRLAPQVYEEECRRVAARFEEAVRLAEEAFTTEFSRLLSHLTERLGRDENGRLNEFRDSTVNNLTAFFQRFQHLNVRSNPELDALVTQAQALVQNRTAQNLRDDQALRQQIATQMAVVQAQVEGMIVAAPRRRIIRARPSDNGGPNGTAS